LSLEVVLDTDFLSAFLKIDRLPLVRSLYRVETLVVPLAVYREIGLTRLLPQLAAAAAWRRNASPNASLKPLLSSAYLT